MIRGETIQSDIPLTLRPRPPTEHTWQAALGVLAQRTSWTGNQSLQKIADWPLGFSATSAYTEINTCFSLNTISRDRK